MKLELTAYDGYVDYYNDNMILGTHDNNGIKHPRIRIIQVIGTIKVIIDENVDQMPYQMRRMDNRYVDTIKFLSARSRARRNWK